MDIPETRRLEAALDSILEQVGEKFDLPGFGVGVVKESEIVYAKGYGVQDIRTQEPVTIRSLFHQASVSKLFTTTAVMQLNEQGQIRLEDPVVRYLPYFRMTKEGSEPITIAQILSHTSGLPDPEDHDWAHPEYDEDTLMRYVSGLHFLEMIAEPGERFNYSSLGRPNR